MKKNQKKNNIDELKILLEFDKILSIVKSYSICELAAEKLDSSSLSHNKEELLKELARVDELKSLLLYDEAFPLQAVWNLKTDLEKAAIPGNYLPIDALIRIYENILTGKSLKRYIGKRKDERPRLWEIIRQHNDCNDILGEIKNKLDLKLKQVKDTASPRLKKLRHEIRNLESKVTREVERIFKLYSGKGYLQDDLLKLSDGRLVLPIKLEHKGKIKGAVHDQSASGSTVYIEPIESMEINNQIINLKIDERREIELILIAITEVVRDNLEAIIQNLALIVEIDVLHAKARFSIEFDCSTPQINRKNEIRILAGQHPLLTLHKADKNPVIPIDVKISDSVRTVIITGPNAGGKSVTLKTIGLFVLMVQSGLPIPASADSNIAAFNKIFADIGDLQSIENDLSTFSSHISKMNEILSQADEHTLVLIDEIGSATDPEEGAALAIAILEELTARNCKTLVTTHLGALKAFAHDYEFIANASMEFDMETLQPTYRFRFGIPGSSYALEICNRHGISEQVVVRSRELIGTQKAKLDNLVIDLEKRLQMSEQLSENLKIEKTRLEGLSNLYRERYETMKRQEKAIKQKALEESEKIITDSNAIIERAIKDIKEQKASRDVIKEVKQTLASQKKRITETEQSMRESEKDGSDELHAKLQPGDAILWTRQNSRGKVLSVQEGEDRVLIQVQNYKFSVPRQELQTAAPGEDDDHVARSGIRIQASEPESGFPEIDLRGSRLEEAIARVDKFLDDALLAGWQQVRIIHGKGTGALRKGIGEFLESHPKVGSKKMGAWNEGDLGVTIVELK